MSPAKKARPAPPEAARKTPAGAKPETESARRELAFLVVGGVALLEGLALILLARSRK
jgi:hypothetical protein